jgi:DNA-binding CsgD family transcriptional regulator
MKATAVVRVVSLCTGPSKMNSPRTHAPLGGTRDFPADGIRKARLTARELEVLSLLCEGLSNKLICRRLDICTGTVKCHVASILSTLGVSSRLQAVVAAHRLGLVGGPQGAAAESDDVSAEDGNSFPSNPLRRRLAEAMGAAA